LKIAKPNIKINATISYWKCVGVGEGDKQIDSENVFDHIESLISNITDSESYNIINNVTTMLFYNIEKNGLKLDKEPFIKHYSNLQYPKFSISKGKIHTQYFS
jgi:hypothetical protein